MRSMHVEEYLVDVTGVVRRRRCRMRGESDMQAFVSHSRL